MRYAHRQNQRGYALLLVFALAAAALVMLYLEMPRVAFEHQRDKEALLVERGEEYVRAIQLYVQKFQKYPQSLDDLDTSNPANIRFLRKRFRDPITGEDEWRLIHIDAAGQYVDSLVHKRQEQKKESTTNALMAGVQGIGVSAQVVTPEGQSAAALNPALRRTASDRIIPGLAPGEPSAEPRSEEGTPGTEPPGEGADPPPESQAPVQPGMETPVAGEPGSPAGGAPQAGRFRMPGNVPQPGQPGMPAQPGSPQPAQPAAPGLGFGGGIGSVSATPPPPPGQEGLAPGMVPPQMLTTSAGGPAPGMGQAGAPNQALQAIQRVLTRQPAQGAPQMGGMTLGGGIAGVASKTDMEGIRTYNDRTNYKEWEFLFDFRRAMQAAGMGAGQPGQPGAPGQGGQQASPFERPGRSSGFGTGGIGSSGFGSSGQGGRGGFTGSSFGGSGFGGNQPQPAPPPRP